MLKMITMMRRKKGITLEEFRNHEENIHVPLVRSIMGDDLKAYVRNYPQHGAAAAFQNEIEFDLIVESYFDDLEAYGRAIAAANRHPNREALKADYTHYLDKDSVRQCLVEIEDQ